jgi:hypothetical protein
MRSARCQDFLASLAPQSIIPVNRSGLADRWATQRVDGGSPAAVAGGRRYGTILIDGSGTRWWTCSRTRPPKRW